MNSFNMPNVTAEEAPRLAPYLDLAEKLGSFAGQLIDTDIKAVSIDYEGDVAGLNVNPLSQVALMGVLRPQLTSVNMVNAPVIARERGIEIEAEFAPHMLHITNDDKPGFIGRLGTILGESKVNIATFHLGRDKRAARRSPWSRSTTRSRPSFQARSPPSRAWCRPRCWGFRRLACSQDLMLRRPRSGRLEAWQQQDQFHQRAKATSPDSSRTAARCSSR